MTWFDESRLDDEAALAGHRRRRCVRSPRPAPACAARRVRRRPRSPRPSPAARTRPRPRAVLAAGPDSRLLRAVLEPWCPVPFVAWPSPNLPGWAGSLDLVVVLAPDGHGAGVASAVAEAVRRGCQVVVACPAGSQVAEHAAGRYSSVLPTVSRDQLATAVVVLEYLERVALGPRTDAEAVATALDQVATECSPFRDLAVNPAKMLAIAMADTNPVVWGGSRAGRPRRPPDRRVDPPGQRPRRPRRATPSTCCRCSRPPVPADTFADPFADGPASGERRPMLLVLDDGSEEAVVREERGRLQAAAAARGVRVERLTTDAPTEVARYASLYLSGSYAAQYLRPRSGRRLTASTARRRSTAWRGPRLARRTGWVGHLHDVARRLARQRQDGPGHPGGGRPRLDAAARPRGQRVALRLPLRLARAGVRAGHRLPLAQLRLDPVAAAVAGDDRRGARTSSSSR